MKAVSEKLQVSLGSMKAVSEFFPQEKWINMQLANKFFYETAVSRVQTGIKSAKQEKMLRKISESKKRPAA